jgi:hypothetical protein
MYLFCLDLQSFDLTAFWEGKQGFRRDAYHPLALEGNTDVSGQRFLCAATIPLWA